MRATHEPPPEKPAGNFELEREDDINVAGSGVWGRQTKVDDANARARTVMDQILQELAKGGL